MRTRFLIRASSVAVGCSFLELTACGFSTYAYLSEKRYVTCVRALRRNFRTRRPCGTRAAPMSPEPPRAYYNVAELNMEDHRDGKVRIVVVDDHALFRESLSRLLAADPGLEVLAPCGTVEEALTLLERSSVDVVLLDYEFGSERGTKFLLQARDRGLRTRTLVLTAGMDDAAVLEVLRFGAAGVFLKHNPSALLIKAIFRVAAGEVWLEQRYVRLALSQGQDPQNGSQLFTERERRVLEGILEGLTSKEIAGRLCLSESSVKSALRQLFAKTGARNRAQLVRVALERYRGYW